MLEKIIKKTTFRDALIIIISSLAIVGFWRGVWNLTDKYLLPNHFVLSQIISIGFGLIILIIIAEYRGGEEKKVMKFIKNPTK